MTSGSGNPWMPQGTSGRDRSIESVAPAFLAGLLDNKSKRSPRMGSDAHVAVAGDRDTWYSRSEPAPRWNLDIHLRRTYVECRTAGLVGSSIRWMTWTGVQPQGAPSPKSQHLLHAVHDLRFGCVVLPLDPERPPVVGAMALLAPFAEFRHLAW